MPATRQAIPTPGAAPGDPKWVRELKGVLARLAQAVADSCYAPDGVTIIAKGRSISALAPVALHPWKIWLKPYGGGWKYAICEQEPGTSGAVAGRIIKPDGVVMTVAEVGWTSISATTSFYLSLSINEGSCTASIVTSAPSVDAKADPAILGYEIGTITFRNSVPITTLQKLNCDVNLTGALIPAWYAGYQAGQVQQLIHYGSSAPSWHLGPVLTVDDTVVKRLSSVDYSSGTITKTPKGFKLDLTNNDLSIVESTADTPETVAEAEDFVCPD